MMEIVMDFVNLIKQQKAPKNLFCSYSKTQWLPGKLLQ